MNALYLDTSQTNAAIKTEDDAVAEDIVDQSSAAPKKRGPRPEAPTPTKKMHRARVLPDKHSPEKMDMKDALRAAISEAEVLSCAHLFGSMHAEISVQRATVPCTHLQSSHTSVFS